MRGWISGVMTVPMTGTGGISRWNILSHTCSRTIEIRREEKSDIMKNFLFISPNFPENYWMFCRELKKNGLNVLGIGDQPYEEPVSYTHLDVYKRQEGKLGRCR